MLVNMPLDSLPSLPGWAAREMCQDTGAGMLCQMWQCSHCTKHFSAICSVLCKKVMYEPLRDSFQQASFSALFDFAFSCFVPEGYMTACN
jgi:hypothetical protein